MWTAFLKVFTETLLVVIIFSKSKTVWLMVWQKYEKLGQSTRPLDFFPVAAITNFHKLGNLKQHEFIIHQFQRSTVWDWSQWAKLKVWAMLHFFSKLCKWPVSLPFLTSRSYLHSLAHGSLLPSSKPATLTKSFLCCHLSSTSFTYKDSPPG